MAKPETRVARVELPESLRKQIAKELNIRNDKRIPSHLVLTGVSPDLAKAVGAAEFGRIMTDVVVA